MLYTGQSYRPMIFVRKLTYHQKYVSHILIINLILKDIKRILEFLTIVKGRYYLYTIILKKNTTISVFYFELATDFPIN